MQLPRVSLNLDAATAIVHRNRNKLIIHSEISSFPCLERKERVFDEEGRAKPGSNVIKKLYSFAALLRKMFIQILRILGIGK